MCRNLKSPYCKADLLANIQEKIFHYEFNIAKWEARPENQKEKAVKRLKSNVDNLKVLQAKVQSSKLDFELVRFAKKTKISSMDFNLLYKNPVPKNRNFDEFCKEFE